MPSSSTRRISPEACQPLDEEVDEALRVDVDPDVRVRLPAGSAPEVDVGAAARELAAAVDDDAAVGRPDEARPDDVGDGDGVVDRRAVPAVLARVELQVEGEQLRDEAPDAA